MSQQPKGMIYSNGVWITVEAYVRNIIRSKEIRK